MTQEKISNVIQQQVNQGIENYEQPNVSIIYQQSEMHPTCMMKSTQSLNPSYTDPLHHLTAILVQPVIPTEIQSNIISPIQVFETSN